MHVADWTQFSWDPNAAVVLARRAQLVAEARKPPVSDRIGYLTGLAEGRSVLDVGVVEHGLESAGSSRWLHRHLVAAAERCVGVDILADEAAELVRRGFDVRVHDLTASPMDSTYDLIVAGEVVEHLDAPGPFLRNVRTMLNPGGRFVMTTVNPYMLHRVWHHLRGRYPDSADHVIMMSPGTMVEMARRAGLVLDSWRGIALKDLPGPKNRIASLARRSLAATLFGEAVGFDSIIYELVPG
jgi:SAM-dependent methyltransferase